VPTVQQLDLTMSLDSNGQISAQVDYTLGFSEAEIAADVEFAERAVLLRRLGARDLFSLQAVPGPRAGVQLVHAEAPGDLADEAITVFVDATARFDSLGVPAQAPAEVARSFRHVLTAEEAAALVEVGREHPYVVVTVVPVGITADVQFAQVDIDVGDPGPGADFAVGAAPRGVAATGDGVWVANSGGNSVTRLAAEGSAIDSFRVGATPVAVAYDDGNLWVVNAGDNTVTPVDPDHGQVLGVAAIEAPTTVVVADGQIWAAGTGHVHELAHDTGAILATYAVGASPSGLALQGTVLWITDEQEGTVRKLRTDDGALLGNYPVGAAPLAVAADAENVWVANSGDDTVTKLRAADGLNLGTFRVGSRPVSIALGTDKVWVVNSGGNSVSTLRPSDGGIEGTILVGEAPNAIAYDGHSLWVTNEESGTVSRRPG
jgi:hypothetical protein